MLALKFRINARNWYYSFCKGRPVTRVCRLGPSVNPEGQPGQAYRCLYVQGLFLSPSKLQDGLFNKITCGCFNICWGLTRAHYPTLHGPKIQTKCGGLNAIVTKCCAIARCMMFTTHDTVARARARLFTADGAVHSSRIGISMTQAYPQLCFARTSL